MNSLVFLQTKKKIDIYHQFILYNKMGVILSTASSQPSTLIDSLNLILTENSPDFGETDIYRRNEKPYDYYMRYTESSNDSEQTYANMQHKKMVYQRLTGHRNIAQVEATAIRKMIDICSNSICLDSYAKYHNYTLEQAIARKLQKGKQFRQADLLYVLQSLLSVGQKFSSVCGKQYKGLFKSSKVYLSTEGYIKVYPFHLLNIKNCNATTLQPDTNKTRVIHHEMEVSFSPLKGQNGREVERMIRTSRDDMRDIGNLIIELSLLITIDSYDLTKEKDRCILESKLRDRISIGLAQILLLLVYNSQACDFKQILAKLRTVKQEGSIRAAYCICLDDDIPTCKRELLLAKQHQQQLLKQSQKDEQLSRQSETAPNLTPSKYRLEQHVLGDIEE